MDKQLLVTINARKKPRTQPYVLLHENREHIFRKNGQVLPQDKTPIYMGINGHMLPQDKTPIYIEVNGQVLPQDKTQSTWE